MRIAVLTSLYPTASLPYEGIFAERRWLGMARRGHDIEVVQPLPHSLPVGPKHWRAIAASPREEVRSGIRVRRPRYLHVPGLGLSNARRFVRRGLARVLSGPRPDVVVADYAWPAAVAAPLCRREGVPVVVSGRGSDVLLVAADTGLRPALADALRAAGHWCAVSRHLVEAMDRLAGMPGRGVLVPNGVDLGLFRVRDRAEARRALGLEEAGALVLVVGHLIERKDPLLSADAFAAGAPPDARIAFVGRGPLEEPLRARIEELGLGGRATLAGEVPPDRLSDWYAAGDLLLLTSTREGRPNVVLEALASGRPVLATEAGGTAELLDGLDGMLSRTRDARALGSMLGAILAAPPDAEALRAHVEPLSWECSLDVLEGCLERVVRTH